MIMEQSECNVASFRVEGTLHSREEGGMTIVKTRKGWEQRGTTETTRHLNRDYVSGESFDAVTQNWLPHDFREFSVFVETLESNAEEPDSPKAA